MTFLDLLILTLATFRLTIMISKESGPGWIFKHLRWFVKRKAPKESHMDEGIECAWCMSMQLGILVSVSQYFLGNYIAYNLGILALALSGGAVILNQTFTKEK